MMEAPLPLRILDNPEDMERLLRKDDAMTFQESTTLTAPTPTAPTTPPPTFPASPPPPPTLSPTVKSNPAPTENGRGLPVSGITLQAIGLTLGGGLCVLFLTVMAFGIAVMRRHTNIAPRCTSRHPNTIWRSRRDMYGNSFGKKMKKNSKSGSGSSSGGGANAAAAKEKETKKGELHMDNKGEVKFRSTNITTDAQIGLPLNNSSGTLSEFNLESPNSNDNTTKNEQFYAHPQDRGNPFLGWVPWALNLSYDRMLRGIPGTGTREGGMSGKLLSVNLDSIVMFRFHALCLRVTIVVCILSIGIILPLNMTACSECEDNELTNYGETTIANVVQTIKNDSETTTNIFSTIFWGAGQNLYSLLRLYAIALCTWYITYYTLKNIERDWKENLVLRRVYYLEADHYGNRQSELAKTVYDDNGAVSTGKYKHRNPWIPNPEHRETVPGIELYSVLVGGLPSILDEVVNSKDMQAALGYSNQASIDWQLAVATTFFDHCVPNQPGFSSSVVAVTILPGAPELAKAWRKWYRAAATLRRLRFIRQIIHEKRHYDIDDEGDCVDPADKDEYYMEEEGADDAEDPDPQSILFNENDYSMGERTPSPSKQVSFFDHGGASPQQYKDVETGQPAVGSPDRDYRLFRSLNYGPEQQAVYTREFAQGAAACCPNGCCEGPTKRQPIDKLEEMERETIERLENARQELKDAQMQAAVSIIDGGDKKVKNSLSSPSPSSEDEGDESINMRVGPADLKFLSSDNAISRKSSVQSLTVEVSPRTGGVPVAFDDQHVSLDDMATPTNGSLSPKTKFHSPIPGANNLRMTSEGRFLFNSMGLDEGDEQLSRTPSMESSSLRRRANTVYSSAMSEGDLSKSSNQWNQVNSILRTNTQHERDTFLESGGSTRNNDPIASGVWQKPSLQSFISAVKSDILSSLSAIGKWTKGKTDNVTSKLAKDSTYAVVTFSSRQAAVAARHCLADGRGVQKWLSVDSLPVAPLADAAPCDFITCRGCCRPVTLNLNDNQLMIRRYLALASLAFIYIFYTIPITAAQSLVAPDKLRETLPGLHDWISNTKYLSAEIMSGLVSALLYTTFFALCPVLFKAIANSGSQATSVQEAEKYALKYYWYFMLVTAFVFTGLAETAISIWNHSGNVEESIEKLLNNIADQTPLTTAATWLNWIIVRATMTLPLQYLLQMNAFMFDCIGWRCCARCVIGGGPGGPIPYRIYIDGGTVFLCVVALAPQSPLVAPVSLLYYLFCVPLWRRNCIFMYRPKFDSGGEYWPFLSDMLITSLFMGQFLLTLHLVLKNAFGPALIAACPSVPTYLFRNYLMKRFKRAYDDAGLLQTSLLDGWDNTIPTSVESREEFRKFLVDAHKAAYIPVCIAGGATNILTAEPAVVMPSENDDLLGYGDLAATDVSTSPYFRDQPQSHQSPSAVSGIEGVSTPKVLSQRGTCVRRTMSYSGQTPTSKRADRGVETPRGPI